MSPDVVVEIRLWLCPTEFDAEGSEYRKHLNAHVPGTSDWLFHTERYQQWHRSGDTGLLWIRGIPGSGKSVLAAHLIQKFSKVEDTPVLFFFSRRILMSNSEPKRLLRDCLYQALGHSELLYWRLKKIMDQYPEIGHVPCHEFWRILLSVLPTIPKVYIVLDALDELAVEQDNFLENLLHLSKIQPQTIKLIVTSRSLPHLEKTLATSSSANLRLSGQLVERDVATYITHRMTSQKEIILTNEEQSAIKDILCTKSRGLFLYARLMLDDLLPRQGSIQMHLERLPASLGDMYEGLLKEHSVRSGASTEFQTLLLSWVTHASRPFRLSELSALVNFLGDRGGLKESQEAKFMIRISCGPLLEVLADETVQVVHHSFTEFLLDTSRCNGKQPTESGMWCLPALTPSLVHRSLAATCVEYLLSGCFESWVHEIIYDHPAFTERQKKDFIVRFHMLQYASQNWMYHAAKYDIFDAELFSKFDRLLMDGSHDFKSWKDFWFQKDQMGLEGADSLHVAAQAGLSAYTEYLLGKGRNPNHVDSRGRTIVAVAAIEGHAKTVTVLVEHNACIRTPDLGGLAPIHHAAKGNHIEVLRYLLAAGVDPMSPKLKEDPDCIEEYHGQGSTLEKTPIQYACELGNSETVVELLQHIGPQSRAMVYPHWAAATGQATVLNILLEYPEVLANINKKAENGTTPLFLAACVGDSATVRALLEHGADVNGGSPNVLKTKLGQADPRPTDELPTCSPIHGLVHFWSRENNFRPDIFIDEIEKCLLLLIGSGCDIDDKNAAGETALLAWADQFGFGQRDSDLSARFVSILLEHGANPCATDSQGNTALHKIPRWSHTLWSEAEKVVKLLIEAGADINCASNSDGSTPLIAAARKQNVDVSILIQHGADPNNQDSDGNTALHHICKSWLLERSHIKKWLEFADPKIKNKNGETCVYNFRWGDGGSGRVNSIKLLMDKGLDLESRNIRGRTALLAACENAELHFVHGLLENGADPRATDFQNKNCLHVLAKTQLSNDDGGKKDFREIFNLIQHLIRGGLDINAVDLAGNTPLHDASSWDSYWRRVEINLKAILKSGAVANRPNHRGRTALHLAATVSDNDHCSIGNEWPSRLDFLMRPDLEIDIHARDHDGTMAIHSAVSTSEINTWRLVLAGADLKARALDGRTPLHFAAQAAQSNVVGLLCQLYHERSWTMDQKDDKGRTPLHEATRAGNSECVYYLLKYGADPNIKDKKDATPLHAMVEHRSNSTMSREPLEDERLAAPGHLPRELRNFVRYPLSEDWYSNTQSKFRIAVKQEEDACVLQDVCRLLLAAGANLATRDKSSHTAYEVAVMSGCEAVIQALFSRMQKAQAGIASAATNPLAEQWHSMRATYAGNIVQNININAGNSYSLLETALYFKNEAILNALLKAGADPRIIGPSGLTPAHLAAFWGLISMMKAISSYVTDMDIFSPPLLHVAACRKLSNIQMVKLLLKIGVDVNASFKEHEEKHSDNPGPVLSYTAVHILAAGERWWQISALQALCDAGADVELRDADDRTALQCALSGRRSGSHAVGFWRDQTLEVLLAHGAKVNALSLENESTPLIAALEAKREPWLIRKLLDHGAELSLGAMSALFTAIESESLEATKIILGAGADVNVTCQPKERRMYGRGPRFETPLLAAAVWWANVAIDDKSAKSRESIMAFLLQHGANPTMELDDGETTIFHEIAYYSGILTPILESGVNLEVKDRRGRTPLLRTCFPVEESYRSIVGEYSAQELIRAGANVQAKDRTGSTALHFATESGLVKTVSLLISQGLSVTAANDDGHTPLYNAMSTQCTYLERTKLIRTLLSAGADPLFLGPNGETALHILAPDFMFLSPANKPLFYEGEAHYLDEHYQLYQHFVDLGCDRNARDSLGETPLFRYLSTVKSQSDAVPHHPPAWEDIERMLEQHDIFAVNDNGDTLLHIVARRKDELPDFCTSDDDDGVTVSLFKELIDRGLDPKTENKDGLSALDVAAAYKKEGVLALFQECSES